MKPYDVIILGGGAAGLMCASEAGKRGLDVVVLESSNKVGKKILMSGGGRCNFTNTGTAPANFISANKNFCISALKRYTPVDFIALVEKYGINFHEKSAGQLFCDDSSKDILAMLQQECAAADVTILTDCDIRSIEQADGFVVQSHQAQFSAPKLVVATGGLSIPKMGASDLGYRIARQFGLAVHETRAALVPFTFSGTLHETCSRLSGVSVHARLSTRTATGNVSFAESILFTHRGLSGPASLQLSSYWQPGSSIKANLLPDTNASDLLLTAKREQPRALLRTVISELLPRALVLELQTLLWSQHEETRLADIPDKMLRHIGGQLNGWDIKPAGTEGYRTAEVTLGGVDTDELSSKTMEAKQMPGLYFIGEVVDVTGQLGGFNFQWAWASAQAAAAAL